MNSYKAHAKVNIFLKITGVRRNYHEILSRFVRVNDMYDTLSFIPKQSNQAFELYGKFGCALEENTLYKVYRLLLDEGYTHVETWMQSNALQVEKRIPSFAGLGGGSSDAATFLKMLNEVAELNISKEEMARLGSRIGADIPFFVFDYVSANVSGIGEIVEPFKEESLNFDFVLPGIECSTPHVYQTFRRNYFKTLASEEQAIFKNKTSMEILEELSLEEANDLFLPALQLCPNLESYAKDGWFFSGSGSSFFKVRQ